VNTNEQRNEIIEQLKDKEYRDAFVSASINIGIPSQIQILRDQRKWKQKDLGDKAGMAQESISRIEDPTRGSVNNIKTLIRLASAFDVGLMVRFVPFSELAELKLKLSLESLEVKSFENDPYFKEKESSESVVEGHRQFTTIPVTIAANNETVTAGNTALPVSFLPAVALSA